MRQQLPCHLSWQTIRRSNGRREIHWNCTSSSSTVLPDRLRMPILRHEIWRAKFHREAQSGNHRCAGIMGHRSRCFQALQIVVDANHTGSSFTAKAMSDKIKSHPGKPARLIRLILGIVAFGVLMGVREEFESLWQRTLIAASAFMIFGFCVSTYRKADSH